MADLLAELKVGAPAPRQPVNLLAEIQQPEIQQPPPIAVPETDLGTSLFAQSFAESPATRVLQSLGIIDDPEQSAQALLLGAGRGLSIAGRGAERLTGVDVPGVQPTSPEEEQAFRRVEEISPKAAFVGEIAGETAPFLVGGIASVPKTLIPRLTAAFGIGAAEGATIAAGRGETTEDIVKTASLGGTIASAAELVIPVFGRVLGRTLRKLTGKNIDEVIDSAGNINAEVKKTLDEAGVTVEQLQDEAVRTVREAADTPDGLARLRAGIEAGEAPEVASRATLFDDLGIPTVRSRLEQTPEAFLEERRLARQVDSKPAQDLRERLAAESQGFKDTAETLADDLGFGRDAGISIKGALDARRTGEKTKVTALYDDLKMKSQGRGIPLAGDEITTALQDDDVRGLVGRLSQNEIDDLNDRLIEFGIDSNPERVKKWAETRLQKSGGLPTKTDVTPLNVLNFNEFRKALNSMLGPDSSDELRAVAGRIKGGLDNEINVLEAQLKKGDLGDTGKISLDAIQAAKRATNASRLFKDEFGPDKVVNTLIRAKKGSFDEPQILASEVVRKMLSPRDKIGTEEALEAITTSLRQSGKRGKQALGDLQAAAVMDLMEFATKAKSGKLDGGVIEWSGVNFGKRFDAMGERRLNAIFKDKPQALNMLKKLRAAGDLKTEFKTVAKSSGTADDLINFFQGVPFLRSLFGAAAGPGAAIAGVVAEKGAKGIKSRQVRKAVKQRLNTSPVLRERAQAHRLLYPNVLAILGIESVSTQEDK